MAIKHSQVPSAVHLVEPGTISNTEIAENPRIEYRKLDLRGKITSDDLAPGISIGGGTSVHGLLSGLAADDHTQYLLASQATDRASFTLNWADLTDGGQTSLHSHAGGGGITQAQVLARASLRA